MPKLCDNGCARPCSGGRIILINGPAMTKRHLCKICRVALLRGKRDKDSSDSGTISAVTNDSDHKDVG